MTTSKDAAHPPDGVLVKQRWIPLPQVDWVKQCDQIMVEYGAVTGATVYRTRDQARHRARRLVRLMVELRLHERDELVEHTDARRHGFVWSVEYNPRGKQS